MTEISQFYAATESPIGRLLIASDGVALTGLYLPGYRDKPLLSSEQEAQFPIFEQTRSQLEAYFAGRLQKFDLPLAAPGTPFQQRVWQVLVTIPYGQTASYKQVAMQMGNPQAMRPVGMANARNPIAIIVPCHRVIGANGDLVGFGGGLPMKAWLLNHERTQI